jgi:hypothetical protein
LAVKLGPSSGLALAPEFSKLRCAVDVSVDPPVTYCTVTVQLPPALMTSGNGPTKQEPPVIEKLPLAGPAVFTTVGAAVRVSALVAPAALLTVMVPVFVPVPPVFNAGGLPENVTVAPVTVKVTELLVAPPELVTVTV